MALKGHGQTLPLPWVLRLVGVGMGLSPFPTLGGVNGSSGGRTERRSLYLMLCLISN